jgi:hypothetical protein
MLGCNPFSALDIEGMLICADDAGNTLRFDLPDGGVRLTHARCDGSPTPFVGENEITNGNLLDWNVSALGADDRSSDETRIASQHGVDRAAVSGSVEGCDIIPDWGRGEVSGTLGGNDGISWMLFPLDKAAGVEAGFCQHEAHIKATGSGAQG